MKNRYGKDRLSVFISLILRHKPEAAGIILDEHGWANVNELLDGIRNTGRKIDMEELERIVASDSKQRYSFNEDHTLIRANQGHSIPVDVELQELEPPNVLYHGTAIRLLDAIRESGGLKPMGRLYVHLSENYETAFKVGKRHGEPCVLEIDARRMTENRIMFYLSKNGVWLVKAVALEYIKRLDL